MGHLPQKGGELSLSSLEGGTVIGNLRGRRNLTPAWVIELELGKKADLLEIGKANKSKAGGDKKSEAAKSLLSQNDTSDPIVPVSTRAEIAKAAGTSSGQVGMAELGRRYNRTKRGVGKPAGTILGKNCPISTAESLGRQHGVSARTVKNAGQFAAAVDKLADVRPTRAREQPYTKNCGGFRFGPTHARAGATSLSDASSDKLSSDPRARGSNGNQSPVSGLWFVRPTRAREQLVRWQNCPRTNCPTHARPRTTPPPKPMPKTRRQSTTSHYSPAAVCQPTATAQSRLRRSSRNPSAI